MADAAGLQTTTLRDGRTLAWAEYGDPAGAPLLYFHGFPGSRLEAQLSHEPAARAGARIIAVDRPGAGYSSPKPGRRIPDWPDDVAELADALGLARFGAFGVSGGGPYAAACALRLPERLTNVAIVCGVGPFDAPEATDGMMLMNRLLFRASRYSVLLPRLAMAYMIRSLRRDPETAMKQMMHALPAPDRAAFERPEVREMFLAAAREALRQGPGPAARESALYARSWGFRLEDITREVLLYQGELDVNVPPVMGRYQARVLPKCRAHFYPDEGHLSLALNRMDEILSALVA